MQKTHTFISHALVGEDYISPTIKFNLHDDWYTREEMLEHFKQYLVAVGYHFKESEQITITRGE